MKLLIISDLHGSLADCKKALDLFEEKAADRLLILGDILARGGWQSQLEHRPRAVAALLNSQAEKILAVRGNCDSADDQKLLQFPLQPLFATIQAGGRKVFLSHGHIYNENNLPGLEQGDIFLSGHTHIAGIWLKDGFILANPGSISLPKSGQPKSYALLDDSSIRIKDFSGKTLFFQKL